MRNPPACSGGRLWALLSPPTAFVTGKLLCHRHCTKTALPENSARSWGSSPAPPRAGVVAAARRSLTGPHTIPGGSYDPLRITSPALWLLPRCSLERLRRGHRGNNLVFPCYGMCMIPVVDLAKSGIDLAIARTKSRAPRTRDRLLRWARWADRWARWAGRRGKHDRAEALRQEAKQFRADADRAEK